MKKKLTLFQDVRELHSWRAVAFSCALLERMLPNYHLFCSATGFADSAVMDNLLQTLWSWVIDPRTKINLTVQLEKLEEITPDTSEFEHFGVYPALDCAMSMTAVFNLLNKEDEQGAVVVSKLSQGTVENFIEFTDEDVIQAEDRSAAIKAHPLMQWEISTQQEVLDFVKTHDRNKESVRALRALVREEGMSNIGLDMAH
ncbi:YjaG family protein [Alteromonas sp. a30]|uniref:YjaG family protein n=1 Tax=Alteromonas sp. a30 TaxID=2730917 RepID=UPI00227DDD0F|nr:YjaG family protein [Alteromonas sp. a30]